MKTTPLALILVAINTLLTAFASFQFKLGMNKFQFSFIGMITNYNLISGLLIYAIAMLILLFALRSGELSVLYPIIALTYVWSLALAAIYLGEAISYLKIAGVVSILFGVWAIGKGSHIKQTKTLIKVTS